MVKVPRRLTASLHDQAACVGNVGARDRRYSANTLRLWLYARPALERYVRGARIMRIYEGSSEVQRNNIARTVLST